ncbi:MAG: ribonuclease M5 [Spirochaetia bacterium]|nr:ribonuclease M5 [Acholeplasmataceae bacterium]MDD4193823.1 ribonuclease M5 [Acholeplasmataceae bacterium]NCD07742.1 ribonuclease M5 [Spirochaetia bacterium]
MKPIAIVVEGIHDLNRIRSIYQDVLVITTNGSAVEVEILEQLKQLSLTHDIILFLDPDHAGERIRRIISKYVGSVKHAFLSKEESISKNLKKVGIEHASKDAIIKALSELSVEYDYKKSDVDFAFLYEMGLVGQNQSQQKRNLLAKSLNLGHVNGKTLLYRIQRFQITRDQIIEVLK